MGTVDAHVAKSDGFQTILSAKEQRQMLVKQLGGCIEVHWLKLHVFAQGRLAVSIYGRGRRIYQLLYIIYPASIEEIDKTVYIRRNSIPKIVPEHRRGRSRSLIEYDVNTPGSFLHSLVIAYVTLYDFNLHRIQIVGLPQREIVKHAHRMPVLNQAFSQIAPNESGSAGYKDIHSITKIHSHGFKAFQRIHTFLEPFFWHHKSVQIFFVY